MTDKLLSYCLKLTHNHADAEDLAQDARVKAWINRAKFDGRHPDAWQRKIAYHLFCTKRRRKCEVAAPEHTGSYIPHDPIEAKEIAARLEALPEPFRTTVELRALGNSYSEIAQVLGVPEGTVMSRLSRAKRRLLD